METTRRPRIRSRSLSDHWAETLRDRRKLLNLTQRQVAQAADISQQSINLFEAGRRIPADRTKVALARALGTSPGELFPWPPMEDLLTEAMVEQAS